MRKGNDVSVYLVVAANVGHGSLGFGELSTCGVCHGQACSLLTLSRGTALRLATMQRAFATMPSMESEHVALNW